MASALVNLWMSMWEALMSSLGLGGGKEGTLLLLGLDNAGKTTLLHRLRTGDVKHFPPTDRPYQSDKFSFQGLTFQAWDVGGHEAVRHIWDDYVCECSAVIFVVDATDVNRMEEAGFELDALVGEKVVEDIPIAILFNKCDLPGAISSKDICQRMKYDELVQTHGAEKISAFRISVLRGEGYQQAFRWVATFL
jgi:GTP-binding protein SAR1